MKGMAKGAERQAIVEGKAGARAGRCGWWEREGRRIGRRWQNREMLKGRAAQKGRGRDQQSERIQDRGRVECRAATGRHDRQTQVKMGAYRDRVERNAWQAGD